MYFFFFFLNDPATTKIYPLPLPAPFPIKKGIPAGRDVEGVELPLLRVRLHVRADLRSEEHTSELQSRLHLVCRLLLEKKKRPPLASTGRRKIALGCPSPRRI